MICPICQGQGRIAWFESWRPCYCQNPETPAEVLALARELRQLNEAARLERRAELVARSRRGLIDMNENAEVEHAAYMVAHAERVIEAIGTGRCRRCGHELDWLELRFQECIDCGAECKGYDHEAA